MRSAMPLSTFISVRSASVKNARWIAVWRRSTASRSSLTLAKIRVDGPGARLDGFLDDGSERCPPVARVEHCVRRELHEIRGQRSVCSS